MSERKNTQNPLVQVRCITFNHASYIEDAMDGFCMQETDFPFLCTAYDDASTDGEPEVIINYKTEIQIFTYLYGTMMKNAFPNGVSCGFFILHN